MQFSAAATRICLTAVALLVPCAAGAASPRCATPLELADGWVIAADTATAGFDADKLCEAMQTFASSARNLHGLVIERQGQLVAEQYRAGKDATTFTVIPTTTRFDAGTRHDMRSITKSVVSLLWGIAQAEGSTPPLQTPVLGLMPELADLMTDGRERITVEDLLGMRSGLNWNEGGNYRSWQNDENGLMWRGDQARYLFDRPMAAPAGTRFNYNGGSTAVLGLILAQRTGLALPELARRKLFEPLGITDWEWGSDLRGRPRAYSGLRMRPRDLAKLGRMVLDAGAWQGRQIVPGAWLQASFTPRPPNVDYGYQWWMGNVWANGKGYAWRGGLGNGGQRLFMLPELDLVVVMTAGEYNDGSVGRELARLLSLIVAAARGGEGAVAAQAALPDAQNLPVGASAVYTRAVIRSVFEEGAGPRLYIRLKLLPRAKIPFSTLTYRVLDRGLIAALPAGTSVEFRAQRIDGQNILTAIRQRMP